MKKITKRIMALMLSLVMVFGCVPSFINEASAAIDHTVTISNVYDGALASSVKLSTGGSTISGSFSIYEGQNTVTKLEGGKTYSLSGMGMAPSINMDDTCTFAIDSLSRMAFTGDITKTTLNPTTNTYSTGGVFRCNIEFTVLGPYTTPIMTAASEGQDTGLTLTGPREAVYGEDYEYATSPVEAIWIKTSGWKLEGTINSDFLTGSDLFICNGEQSTGYDIDFTIGDIDNPNGYYLELGAESTKNINVTFDITKPLDLFQFSLYSVSGTTKATINLNENYPINISELHCQGFFDSISIIGPGTINSSKMIFIEATGSKFTVNNVIINARTTIDNAPYFTPFACVIDIDIINGSKIICINDIEYDSSFGLFSMGTINVDDSSEFFASDKQVAIYAPESPAIENITPWRCSGNVVTYDNRSSLTEALEEVNISDEYFAVVKDSDPVAYAKTIYKPVEASYLINKVISESITSIDSDIILVSEDDDALKITLNKDIKIASSIKIPSGKKVVLDLNGHVIDRGLIAADKTVTNENDGSAIEIDGGELTIEDSDPDAEHEGFVGTDGLWHLAADYYPVTGEEAKTIYGGIITGGTGYYDSEYDGNIGGAAMIIKGKLYMNGGNLCGNTGEEGGAVEVGNYTTSDAAYFEMNDGSISYNRVYIFHGGAVCFAANGDTNLKFVMNDGIISNNVADINGGGVYVTSGDFIMNDGVISNNTASNYGGGIYSTKLTAIHGGLITGNVANCGGAMQIGTNELYLTADPGKTITITGNIAESAEGGVVDWDGQAHISGKVIIKDNICEALESDSVTLAPQNLVISDYGPITVDGPLTGSEIYISHVDDYDENNIGVLTSGYLTNNPGARVNEFFYFDGPDKFYMDFNDDNELEVKELSDLDLLYSIKNVKPANGKVFADKTYTYKDNSVYLTAEPDEGYMLDKYVVTDKDGTPIEVEDGAFYMPEKSVTVTALFKEIPSSSGGSSKTYKATDTKDTAEKITGSGKKGSTRTIIPQEGRKVANVVVTDKDGNKIDVTKNADGTYSFVQPAENVNVEVTYKNREIVLNIGSTEASVDGEREELDVTPVIRNDRTMLPIRFVAENLGAKVEWDEKNPEYVLITRGDIKIEITLGSDVMKVNGKDYKLDSVAFAENDRTYLPVRAVSEALNAIVEWNENEPFVVRIFERQ